MAKILIAQRSRSSQHLAQVRALLSDNEIVSCHGVIAFATLNGVLLLTDHLVGGLPRFVARGGHVDLIIGIDAVTTADALNELRRLQIGYPDNVRVRVYASQDRTLFHPKGLMFIRADGTSVAIVGSSNFTKGGLVDNAELSIRVDLSATETSQWLEQLTVFTATPRSLGSITDEVVAAIAEQNRSASKPSRRGAQRLILTEGEPETSLTQARILVQLAPMSGGRPSQLGIRADTMGTFFGLRPGAGRRVRLQQVQAGGVPEPLEPPRPLVFPEGSNRNSRIEVAGLRRYTITEDSRPIVIFEHVGESRYRYLILARGDRGYRAVRAYLDALPRSRSMAHSIMTVEHLLAIWPDYPT